jgi:HAE1 family hydrophobic/amphiphilic exporter-1
MKINIEPRLKRIAGVGNVMPLGSNYSMRIWMKPDKMAQYKLVPSDITAVLEKQNIEAATGAFGENHDNTYQYTMKYRGRFSTPEEFGNLVIRSLPGGEVLRLREVADVELGDETYNYTSVLNGHNASMALVFQTAGSNASEVIDEIDKTLEEIAEEMPKGLEIVTLNDASRFLKASIHEVIITLIIAIVLVVLVVYFFLQDIRSTLIPTISIFVSIIGTFAFMSVAGFSINLLTLFALVLAIGTVVDDAIVVVEAVQARFNVGYQSAYMATNHAMKGISSAILTSTFIFMAVFIPVAMMGGTSSMFAVRYHDGGGSRSFGN